MKHQLILLLLACTVSVHAKVKLQPMFSDNMVLQQQTDAPIWGEAAPGKTVTVKTSWNHKTYSAKANTNGRWDVKVQTPKAGGPYQIIVSDGQPVTLKNVMIGEVWLCTGQSNMEMPVDGWGKNKNYQQEIVEAQNYPNIRLLNIKRATSSSPLSHVEAVNDGWEICSSQSIHEFSAAGYFFGRNLQKYRNVPIGLIETCWGGTVAEAWTSKEALSMMPDFHDALEAVSKMPTDQAGRQTAYDRELDKWWTQLNKADQGYTQSKPVWAAASMSDEQWLEAQVPGFFEQNGYPGFDGVVWYRKVIDIPAIWQGKKLTLSLGAIDDNDVTYFNGVEVGRTQGWNLPRKYTVPAKLVKKGKAVIAVRIIDTGGDGGMHGEAHDMKLSGPRNEEISLAGIWKSHASVGIKDIAPMPVNTTNDPNVVTFLYNAMLNPLIPYAVKGAIWYQGEANADRAYQYRELLPLMITDWRNKWGYDFPFYIVQLANFMQVKDQPSESAWAELREAQAMTLRMANTGLACAIDIGEANDIHPKNKQEVGRRLALAALANTYGMKMSYSGPVYRSHVVEGNKVRIYFNHVENGLKSKEGDKLQGFAVAGLDHKFHWADATIDGNSVVVHCPEVAFPVAVRYAWADNPVCNLYNSADLPAVPFRTDDWPGVTSHIGKIR